MPYGVELKKVSKRFDETTALREVNLGVSPGEFVVIVGPSGCGKSTLLRMVAGLEEPTSGEIFIAGKPVSGVDPARRNVAMVFQNYALYPHMTVAQNTAFCLRMRGIDKEQRAHKVQEALQILQLADLANRKPAALSGGQRQRVALARAIVRDPEAFLFDEPLSNLDARLRLDMREEILRIHRRAGKSSLYVTHDQIEAMTMADRVMVLKDGILQQEAVPQDIYHKPANRFVAGFFGTPAMNFLHVHNNENGRVSFELQVLEGLRIPDGKQEAVLGIRPENLRLTDHGNLAGIVQHLELLGDQTTVFFLAGKQMLRFKASSHSDLPRRGKVVNFALDPNALHWFDVDSGLRLEPTE